MSFRYELIFLNISERCFFHTNTVCCVIIPRQRSFGKVMFSVVSVCHFVYRGVLVQGPGLPLYRAPAPATENMLNLVQLAPHCTRFPPRHVQTVQDGPFHTGIPRTSSNLSTMKHRLSASRWLAFD